MDTTTTRRVWESELLAAMRIRAQRLCADVPEESRPAVLEQRLEMLRRMFGGRLWLTPGY